MGPDLFDTQVGLQVQKVENPGMINILYEITHMKAAVKNVLYSELCSAYININIMKCMRYTLRFVKLDLCPLSIFGLFTFSVVQQGVHPSISLYLGSAWYGLKTLNRPLADALVY